MEIAVDLEFENVKIYSNNHLASRKTFLALKKKARRILFLLLALSSTKQSSIYTGGLVLVRDLFLFTFTSNWGWIN